MPLAPPSLFLKLIGLTSARSLGVRHTSFSAQPPDLPSWFYVCLLGFGLCCNLTRHLALYQVSVRRLVRLATPLLPSQPRGFRLAVHYTWRQIPVTGLSPARCASCPTHNKRQPPAAMVLLLLFFCSPTASFPQPSDPRILVCPDRIRRPLPGSAP